MTSFSFFEADEEHSEKIFRKMQHRFQNQKCDQKKLRNLASKFFSGESVDFSGRFSGRFSGQFSGRFSGSLGREAAGWGLGAGWLGCSLGAVRSPEALGAWGWLGAGCPSLWGSPGHWLPSPLGRLEAGGWSLEARGWQLGFGTIWGGGLMLEAGCWMLQTGFQYHLKLYKQPKT